MQCGSIGWSVGATLGYAQAAKDKRVISFIGDGSFQVPKIQNALYLIFRVLSKYVAIYKELTELEYRLRHKRCRR